MAYVKIDGDLVVDEDAPVEVHNDEAASDEARTLMRCVSQITEHCEAIKKILKAIPPSSARQIAEMKVAEAAMWAGQAFIESDR